MIQVYKTTGEYVGTVKTVGAAADISGQAQSNVSTILAGRMNQINGWTFIRGNKGKIETSAKVRTFFAHKKLSIQDFIRK